MKLVNLVNERVGYSHVAYMFSVGFFPHLQSLNVSVMGTLKAKYAVARNDWMMSNPGKKSVSMTSQV